MCEWLIQCQSGSGLQKVCDAISLASGACDFNISWKKREGGGLEGNLYSPVDWRRWSYLLHFPVLSTRCAGVLWPCHLVSPSSSLSLSLSVDLDLLPSSFPLLQCILDSGLSRWITCPTNLDLFFLTFVIDHFSSLSHFIQEIVLWCSSTTNSWFQNLWYVNLAKETLLSITRGIEEGRKAGWRGVGERKDGNK